MEWWRNGVMEEWDIKFMNSSNTPTLQYPNTPLLYSHRLTVSESEDQHT